MAAFSVVVVAITAARLAIFGLIAALLVGVLGLFVWVSLALPVDLPTLLVIECRARAYVALSTSRDDFVLLLTTPFSRLSVRPPCRALLVAFEGLASRALWRLAMIASIASIAIGDGINCIHRDWSIAVCCRLSQLA